MKRRRAARRKANRGIAGLAILLAGALSIGCGGEDALGPIDHEATGERQQALNVQNPPGSSPSWTASKAHNWLIKKSFAYLGTMPGSPIPSGLKENDLHYGAAFADKPWMGPPETISQTHPNGTRVPSARPDLYGDPTTRRNDCNEPWNTQCVEVRYPWSTPDRPNLYMHVRWMGSYLFDAVRKVYAVDNMAHYANQSPVKLDGTLLRDDAMSQGPNGNGAWLHKGANYGPELYKMARRFLPGSLDPAPRLDSLTYVPPPGRITIDGAENADVVVGTYMGGNPNIMTPQGTATWPVWIADQFNVSNLVNNTPARSNRAAGIYLGWATHMMQDVLQPFHAKSTTGEYHQQAEDELDDWITQGKFAHLPVQMPLMGGASYTYSNRPVYYPDFWVDIISGTKKGCDKFDDHVMLTRFNEAISMAQAEYKNVHADKRSSSSASIAANEYLMDVTLKNTIMMIACLKRDVGIKGVVRNESGAALSGAHISVVAIGGGYYASSQSTSSGYSLDLPGTGSYVVTISSPSRHTYVTVLDVEDAGYSQLDVRLIPQGDPIASGIKGTARNLRGTGLGGVVVCATPRETVSGPQRTCATTASDGSYTLKRWAGSFSLDASKTPYKTLKSVAYVGSGYATANFTMTLDIFIDPYIGPRPL